MNPIHSATMCRKGLEFQWLGIFGKKALPHFLPHWDALMCVLGWIGAGWCPRRGIPRIFKISNTLSQDKKKARQSGCTLPGISLNLPFPRQEMP